MALLQVSLTEDAIALEGDIDMAVAEDVRTTVLEAARSGKRVVDLSRVTFMDSSGLRALLVAGTALNGQGPLVLRDPPANVRRLFALALPTGAPGLEIEAR